MFGSDPEQVERCLLQWAAQFTNQANRFRVIRERVTQIEVTKSTPDGAVHVTVNSMGLLTDLVFTDKIQGMHPAEVAMQVMACIRWAQGCLAERAQESLQDAFDGEQSLVDHVLADYRARFPPQPPEPESPRQPGVPATGSGSAEPDGSATRPFPVPPPQHGRGAPEGSGADCADDRTADDRATAIRLDVPDRTLGPELTG